MTAWIRRNICKEPTIRRLLLSLAKIALRLTVPLEVRISVGSEEGDPWERVKYVKNTSLVNPSSNTSPVKYVKNDIHP